MPNYICKAENVAGLDSYVNSRVTTAKTKVLTVEMNESKYWFALGLAGTRYQVVSVIPVENGGIPVYFFPYHSTTANSWHARAYDLSDMSKVTGVYSVIVTYIDLKADVDVGGNVG